MRKAIWTISLATALSSSALLAQEPTWAENLFKIKTGRTHPAFEARVMQQKKAREQASLERFSKLDKNEDGVISSAEWESASIPVAVDADGNGSITLKEWMAASTAGAV